eukprot:COSAG05_NODE_4129_length_1660_cov_1.932735_1_plen_177_part_00
MLPSCSIIGFPGFTPCLRSVGTPRTASGWTLSGFKPPAAVALHWTIWPVQLALAHLKAWIELKLLGLLARLLFVAVSGSTGKGPGLPAPPPPATGKSVVPFSGHHELPRSLLTRSAEHGQSGWALGGQTVPSPACWTPCRKTPAAPPLLPSSITFTGNQKWVKLELPTSLGSPNST